MAARVIDSDVGNNVVWIQRTSRSVGPYYSGERERHKITPSVANFIPFHNTKWLSGI